MSRYQFTVLLEPDVEEPHRYNVRVPTLPGCLTYGESIDDALANAREAITGYIAVLIKAGDPVPLEEHPVIATSVVVLVPSAAQPAAAATATVTATRP